MSLSYPGGQIQLPESVMAAFPGSALMVSGAIHREWRGVVFPHRDAHDVIICTRLYIHAPTEKACNTLASCS